MRNLFLILVACLVLAATGQAQDSIRYTKTSQYSLIYQFTQVYWTVAFGTNIPPGSYNVMTSTGTDAVPVYTPGLYNVVKSTPTGTPQNVAIAVQTYNAAAFVGSPPYPNPFGSTADWTAVSVQNHLAGDPVPFAVSSPGRTMTGTEIRDTSVPANYTPGQTIAPINLNWTVTIGTGAALTTLIMPAGIAANDGKSHTMTVQVNGSTFGTLTVGAGTAGGAYIVETGKPSNPNAKAGDVVQYFVDGTLYSTFVVPASAFLEGNTTYTAPTVTDTITLTKPASTPSPTPNPTNTGNTTGNTPGPPTGTDPNGNPIPGPDIPTTQVNNGNTTISGTGTGATNQDIYNDVYRALNDAGNGSTNTSVSSFTPGLVTGDQATGVGGTQATDLQTHATNAITRWQSANTDGQNVISQFGPGGANALQLPSAGSLGSVSNWAGTVHYAGRTSTLTFDISPYASVVSGFRLACLMALGLIAFFAAIRIVRSGIA